MRPATLRREGSYVVDRMGTVAASADGKTYEFDFDPAADPQMLSDQPMVLLPNLTLMMVQNTLRTVSTGPATRFRVTGLVTEYLGRNYLMLQRAIVTTDPPASQPATQPTAVAAAPATTSAAPLLTPIPPIQPVAQSAMAQATPGATSAPASQPATQATTQAATQPMSAVDVLSDMLRPDSADKLRPLTAVRPERSSDRSTAPRPAAPGMASMILRREGTYVMGPHRPHHPLRRRQDLRVQLRVRRHHHARPAHVLLPNSTLMLARDARANASRDARFRVTGYVTEYQGRNYLLLQKAILVTDNAGLSGG